MPVVMALMGSVGVTAAELFFLSILDFGYFILSTDASLTHRVVFSKLTVIFSLYTILACKPND